MAPFKKIRFIYLEDAESLEETGYLEIKWIP